MALDLNFNFPAILASLLLLYTTALVFYRLYLSPLAKFPGSKLAAATLWYEFYYEVVKKGQFSFKIREWHELYGVYEFVLVLVLGGKGW
jgi:hypothetical protein